MIHHIQKIYICSFESKYHIIIDLQGMYARILSHSRAPSAHTPRPISQQHRSIPPDILRPALPMPLQIFFLSAFYQFLSFCYYFPFISPLFTKRFTLLSPICSVFHIMETEVINAWIGAALEPQVLMRRAHAADGCAQHFFHSLYYCRKEFA